MNRPPRQAAAPPISQSPCFSTGGTVIQRRRLVRLYPSVLFFSLDQEKHNWVMTSIYFMELLAGVVMLIIGALLVLFRWPELCQVRDAVNETETRILRRAAIYCRTVAQKQHPACGLLTTGGGGVSPGARTRTQHVSRKRDLRVCAPCSAPASRHGAFLPRLPAWSCIRRRYGVPLLVPLHPLCFRPRNRSLL